MRTLRVADMYDPTWLKFVRTGAAVGAVEGFVKVVRQGLGGGGGMGSGLDLDGPGNGGQSGRVS